MARIDALAATPIVIVTTTPPAVHTSWSAIAPTVDGGAVSSFGSLIVIDYRTMRTIVVMKPSAGRLLVVSRKCS
jgi:hypothetical protein